MAAPGNQHPPRDTLTAMQQELHLAHNMLADYLERLDVCAPPVIVSQEPVRHPTKPSEDTDVQETLEAPVRFSPEQVRQMATDFAQQLVGKFKALDQLITQLPDVEPHAQVDQRLAQLMGQHLELKQQLRQEQEQTEAVLERVQEAHAAIATCLLQQKHAPAALPLATQ